MTQAKDIMSAPVLALRPTEPLTGAAKALAEHNVGSLPLVDDAGSCVGIVTDRDIVVAGIARDLDPATTPVSVVATSDVRTVDVNDSAEDVARAMGEHRVRRMPVTEDGALVGMIAQADVAREMGNDTSADMLEDISRA